MSEVCSDNRFELIGEFKDKLVKGTNIETSSEEMAVLDNILFRIWQMGWLDKLKAQEPRLLMLEEYKALAEKPKEERDPVWEEWSGSKCTWEMPNQAYGGYGTSWRCWTSRPDQATREATPWK